VQGFIDYVQRIWGGALPGQLIRAILIAAVFELLVFVLARMIRRALGAAMRRDAGRDPSERIRRRRILESIPLLIMRVALYAIAVLMILRIFGLPTGAELLPVIGAVVVIALVVFKRDLRDAARGYLITYDNLYAPGDRVSINDLTGVVTELSLRATHLRTGDGREVVIPNAQVTSVANLSRAEAAGR